MNTKPVGQKTPIGVAVAAMVSRPKGKAGGVDNPELAKIRSGQAGGKRK
jgi:hypothetical protein